MSSETSNPIAIPLKKCNYGTILQIEIQCLTPRTELRIERWKDADSLAEDADANYDDIDNKSDASDSIFTKSRGSSSSNTFFSISHPREHGSRETSLSAVGSHHSFDSMEDSLGREGLSPLSNSSGHVSNVIVGRQDSSCSQTSTSYGSYHVYDSPRSSHSPYNSGISGSGKHLHNQREDSGQLSHSIAASPLRNASSSEFVPDAQALKMEEIKAETRMWERNARKLMLDLEFLRKESIDQEKHLADQDIELGALQAECDGLKQEIRHLKVLLEDSAMKEKATEVLKLQVQDKNDIQLELEEEIKFQKDSNDNLALQLKKTQESNLELVSVLQEMEETIEKQKMEIENLSTPKLEPVEMEMRKAFGGSDLESSFIEHPKADNVAQIEENDKWNLQLQLHKFRESQKSLESTILYLEKTLEDKNHEIEVERDLNTQTLLDSESEWRGRLTLKERENFSLKAKLSEALAAQDSRATESETRRTSDLIEEIKALKEKVQELERDCNELTDENLELLFKLKESRKDISLSGASINSSSKESPTVDPPSTEDSELSMLESQKWQLKEEMKNRELDGVVTGYLQIRYNDLESKCTDLEFQLQAFKDKTCYLEGELEKCSAKAEAQGIEIAELNQKLECHQEEKIENSATRKEHAEVIALDNLVQLNRSLEPKSCVHEAYVQCSDEEIKMMVTDAYNVEQKMEEGLKDYDELKSLEELKPSSEDLETELLAKISEIQELKTDCLLKEEEIEAQRYRQRDMEAQISDLQMIQRQMEENLRTMQREAKTTSGCLENLRNDMMVLNSSKDSHISVNKTLERKLVELESCKQELELTLLEFEQENVHSSERISGLEAQLRYLTDERESSRLEVQYSETHVMNLQSEIRRLENEIATQRTDTRHKLEDMQKRWLEAQEECECLKKSNPRLQATAESLIEECNSLQKSNRELRQQRLELNNQCTVLEAQLMESQNSFSNCSKKLEALEEKFTSMLDEIASKQKMFDSELDALHMQNKEQSEKLVTGESLLNQTYLEKVAEVQKLQQEVAHLGAQISATHDERDRMASEAVLEMHTLRADKDKLEAALEETQGKIESSEKKLDTVQKGYETKVLELMAELAASKANHEVLLSNHKKMTESLENTRLNEEKLKSTVDELDSKLISCKDESLQLTEEISSLKIQLQRIPQLQDEVLALKNELNEIKFENQKLEASLQLISGDYEELKDKSVLFFEKTSSMQNAVFELEDCRRIKVALEEKILRLEGDLTAKEVLCAQDAELKNELGRMKRTNSQLQWKIKSLQEEKEECLKKAEALEEELKQKKGVKEDQIESCANHLDDASSVHEDTQILEDTRGGITKYSNDQRGKSRTYQLEQISRSLNNEDIDQDHTQVDEYYKHTGNSLETEVDIASRIQVLENELAEALEANNIYKAQLKNFLSEEQLGHSDAPINVEVEDEAINKEHKKTVSLLEAELREIRERYLDMSLKYAEVEAQREQLVLKLKNVGQGKKWFS